MPSHEDPPPTIRRRVVQAFWLTAFVFRALGRAIAIWPWSRNDWPFQRLVLVSLLRQVSPLEHPRNVMPALPTGEALRLWAGKHEIEHASQTLSVPSIGLARQFPDVTLHSITIDRPVSSSKVVFYIHGGGFRSPLNPRAQLPILVSLAKTLLTSKIYIPEYNLAPMDSYPTQPAQVYAALQHIISQGTRLGDIILIGDSAGGTLALSLLAHIIQPAPFHPPFTDLDPGDRFHATLLVSPYIKFHPTTATLTPSWTSNAKRDYISRKAELHFQKVYQPAGEVWAEPAHQSVPPGFWKQVASESITVVIGEWEVIRDDVIGFSRGLEEDTRARSDLKVEVLLADKAVHVESALDAALGIGNGSMIKLLLEWAKRTADRSSSNI